MLKHHSENYCICILQYIGFQTLCTMTSFNKVVFCACLPLVFVSNLAMT